MTLEEQLAVVRLWTSKTKQFKQHQPTLNYNEVIPAEMLYQQACRAVKQNETSVANKFMAKAAQLGHFSALHFVVVEQLKMLKKNPKEAPEIAGKLFSMQANLTQLHLGPGCALYARAMLDLASTAYKAKEKTLAKLYTQIMFRHLSLAIGLMPASGMVISNYFPVGTRLEKLLGFSEARNWTHSFQRLCKGPAKLLGDEKVAEIFRQGAAEAKRIINTLKLDKSEVNILSQKSPQSCGKSLKTSINF